MQPDNMRPSRVVALALIAGAFFTAQEVFIDIARGQMKELPSDMWNGVQIWGVWALLTPAIVRASQRWPVDRRPLAQPVLAHLALALALATVRNLAGTALFRAGLHAQGMLSIHDALTTLPNPVGFVSGLFTGVLYYAMVLIVFTALRFRNNAEVLETELTRSKLDTLRSQLRPHFLFNTLNAIFGLIAEDAATAQRMVLHLSTLLRGSLDEQAHEVPLRRELTYLEEYLEIQRTRFGGRLHIAVTVDPAVLDMAVPVFLLQPLAENAIEHGESTDRHTRIRLHASAEDGALRIVIEDEGPGLASSTPVREGIGLRNTRARLLHLYGPTATVDLRSANGTPEGYGVRVELRIPSRRLPGDG